MRTHHKWHPPVLTTGTGGWVWACAVCELIVETPRQDVSPASVVLGRRVNGHRVSRNYMLPSCKVKVVRAPAPTADVGRSTDPYRSRSHEYATCCTALGPGWVAATIGPRRRNSEGGLDPDWEIGLLQLYAAVRALDLDAVDIIPVIRKRMQEVSRNQAGEISTNVRSLY